MGEEEVETPRPFPTAQEFFELYTKPMDGESEESPMMYYYNTPKGGHLCVFGDTPSPEEGGIQKMIAGMLAKLRVEAGPADWVWFGSEAYGRTFEKGEAPEGGLRPGQLQEAVEAGTDPKIRELVIIAGAERGGQVIAAQRAFERKDGEVLWLEDLVADVSEGEEGMIVAGGIPDLLARAVR